MTTKHIETTVEWDTETDAVCAAILESVAEAKAIDPLEIATPLYDVVDPDALDRLFTNTGAGGRFTFRYEGCEITVESEGRVTARPAVSVPDERRDAAPAIEAAGPK